MRRTPINNKYKLLHLDDVSLKLLDERDDFEKNFLINSELAVPCACKGIIEYIDPSIAIKMNINIGDKVYFDARYSTEIKHLKLIIVKKDNLLIAFEKESV